jgi:hypothetical protein
MQLDVDDDLYRRLERRAEETGFESAEEYSLVVLRTVIDEVTEAEDDEVRDRLEDLGYLG